MAGTVHAPPRNIAELLLLAMLIVTSLVLPVVLHTPERCLVRSRFHKIDYRDPSGLSPDGLLNRKLALRNHMNVLENSL
jgi:hypothetical protein